MAWKIYDKTGNTERCTVHKLEYSGTWMGECFVTATVYSAGVIGFSIGDFMEYRGERFELEMQPTIKKISSREYEYELRLVSMKYELERCQMRDIVPNDNGVVYPTPLNIEFTGDVRYLAERIQACMDALYGTGKWSITVAEGVTSEEKNISLSNTNCWNALSLVNTEYGLNFYITGRTVTIGDESPVISHVFEYGKNKGLYEIERVADTDTGVVTKLRAYGGTRNLDYSYPKKPEWPDSVLESTFVLSPMRLMLPSFKLDGKTDYVLASDEAVSRYGIREGSITYDDIYPSITGMTNSAGQAVDELKSVTPVTNNDSPTFQVTLYDLGFDLEESLTTDDAQLSMKSGTLQGYTFNITQIDKQGDGSYLLTLGRSTISEGDTGNYSVPNTDLNADAGDKFVLLNILMPKAYIEDAENRLLERAQEYLSKYSETNFSYNIGVDEIFMLRNPELLNGLKEGKKLVLDDGQMGITEKSITIQSVTITEGDGPSPKISVTLNDNPSAGTLSRIQGQVDNIESTVNNQFSSATELANQYKKKLDKVVWDSVFIRHYDNPENPSEITSLESLVPFWTNGWISALGKNPESGGSSTGATTLGGLSNVGSWADQAATADRILVQLAGSSDWTSKPLSEVVGLDTAALAQYLTNNNYAKKSDIPSLDGYATQQWVSTQLGSYVTTSALTTALKSYYTSSEVDDKLKKKVDAAWFAKLIAAIAGDGTEIAVNDMNTAIASIKAKFGLWSESYLSALGNNGSGGSGGGGVSYDRLDAWGDYDTGKSGWVLSAGLGYDLYTRVTALQGAGYATQAWVTGQGYAKVSDLDERIDALVNGAPAAYDTLKEIADVLQGNVDSIGDILTTLGTKADKKVSIVAGTGLTGGGDLSTSRTIALATVGTAGTYTKVKVDAYGRVTGHASLAAGDIPSLDWSKITSGKPTTLAGYGITDAFTKTDADARYVNVSGDTMTGALTVESTITASGLITASAGITTPQYIQIGSGRIKWDATNNALYIEKSDGTAIGFYTKGYISALGSNSDAGGSVVGVTSLSKLDDVSLGGLSAGQILSYNGTKWTNVAMPSVGATSLSGLTDLNSSWISLLQSAPSAYVTRWPTAAEVGALTQATADSRYALTTGTNATGTWPVSITGNAATATKLNSRGNLTALTGHSMGEAGFNLYQVYNNGYPVAYGNVLHARGMGAGELLMAWSGTDGGYAGLYYRNHRDNETSANWSDWVTVLDSSNYTTYTVTKTGGGASGTWPISISGTSQGLGDLKYISLYKNDNSGWPTYILICDITDIWGKTSNGGSYGFDGLVVQKRVGGSDIQHVGFIKAGMGWSYTSRAFSSTVNTVMPYVVQYNNRQYIALRLIGSGNNIYLLGRAVNLLSSFTQLNCTDSAGTLSGLTILLSPSSYYIEGDISGNATTASKWSTARTITLTGAVTGSVSLDGSGNVSMATTYATGNISALDSRYVNVSGDTMTGILNVNHTNIWLSPSRIQIGRTDTTLYTDRAVIGVTNGNLHIDSYRGYHIYFNHYQAGNNVSNSVVVHSNGNLGVGVVPSYKLHVVGDIYSTTNMYVAGNKVWHAGNDGSGSGLDADLLDGVQNGYVTANHFYISGGVSDFNTLAGNGIYSWGNNISNQPNSYGAVLQFSNVNNPVPGTSQHWLTQIASSTNNRIYYRTRTNTGGWNGWSTFAFLTDNVASATRLQTARTLWGQSFNGTANVSGNMTGVGSISASGAITTTSTVYGKVGVYSDGYVSAKGQNTSSDLRLKTKLRDITLSPASIAAAPSMLFAWKQNGLKDVGSSAQYWKNILPDAVKERDGWLEMAYGNIALVSAISLAKHVVSHEERIRRLEQENARLRRQLRQQGIAA